MTTQYAILNGDGDIVFTGHGGAPVIITKDVLKAALSDDTSEDNDKNDDTSDDKIKSDFKFSGIIDCNTSVCIPNLSHEEISGIVKFLKAVDDSYCSYVDIFELSHGIDTISIGRILNE